MSQVSFPFKQREQGERARRVPSSLSCTTLPCSSVWKLIVHKCSCLFHLHLLETGCNVWHHPTLRNPWNFFFSDFPSLLLPLMAPQEPLSISLPNPKTHTHTHMRIHTHFPKINLFIKFLSLVFSSKFLSMVTNVLETLSWQLPHLCSYLST